MTNTMGNRVRVAVAAGLIIAGGGLVYVLAPILTPFLAGLALAYLGSPLVARLEGWHWPRTLAVSVVFGVILLFLLGAVLVLIPALQRQALVFAAKLPGYLDWLQTRAIPYLQASLGVSLPELELGTLRETLVAHWRDVGGWLGKAVSRVSRSGLQLLGWLVNLALIPLVTFYLLRDWDVMLDRIKGLLPPPARPRLGALAREADDVLAAFLRGQLLVMLVLAMVYALGLSLLGLDLALPIGLLAGLVSFVPYLGVIVGLAAAGLAALLQFQDPVMVAGVAAVFAVGQVLEGFVLTPLLVGERLGLHPLAVIFAVMAGGQLFGFVGILLALPAAAVLLVAVRHVHQAYVDEVPAVGPSARGGP